MFPARPDHQFQSEHKHAAASSHQHSSHQHQQNVVVYFKVADCYYLTPGLWIKHETVSKILSRIQKCQFCLLFTIISTYPLPLMDHGLHIICKSIGDLFYRIQSLGPIFIIFQTRNVDVKSWQETRSRNILIKTPQKLTFVRDQIFIVTVVNSGTWRVWSQGRRQFLHFGPASQYKTNYFY